MLTRSLVPLAALLASSAAFAATPPPPGGIPDVVGARTLALEATVGVAAGNDGIFVNPAALAARRRYSLEAMYLLDRRGSATVGQFAGGSVVDSISAPVTAAVSYLRAGKGAFNGNVVDFAIAGPVVSNLYLGLTGRYLSLTGSAKDVSAGTGDVGLFWQVTQYVSLGAAGYNLVPIANPTVAPLGAGAGFAIGSDTSFQVTADWRGDFDRADGKTTNRYAVGAEALIGSTVPVRAGYMHDETLSTDWWSAGTGIVTSKVGLDLAYRQSIQDSSARMFAASLKVFLFD